MPKEVTATMLRQNLYRILDELAESGEPIEIVRKGSRIRLTRVCDPNPLTRLKRRPCIVGDPEELVHVDWSSEWNPEPF